MGSLTHFSFSAPVDCKWSDWSEYGRCQPIGLTYPDKYNVKYRKIEVSPRNGGKSCYGKGKLGAFDKKVCKGLYLLSIYACSEGS